MQGLPNPYALSNGNLSLVCSAGCSSARLVTRTHLGLQSANLVCNLVSFSYLGQWLGDDLHVALW